MCKRMANEETETEIDGNEKPREKEATHRISLIFTSYTRICSPTQMIRLGTAPIVHKSQGIIHSNPPWIKLHIIYVANGSKTGFHFFEVYMARHVVLIRPFIFMFEIKRKCKHEKL